jgi:hypothetical protein
VAFVEAAAIAVLGVTVVQQAAIPASPHSLAMCLQQSASEAFIGFAGIVHNMTGASNDANARSAITKCSRPTPAGLPELKVMQCILHGIASTREIQ